MLNDCPRCISDAAASGYRDIDGRCTGFKGRAESVKDYFGSLYITRKRGLNNYISDLLALSGQF
jgi:hypothetical protein